MFKSKHDYVDQVASELREFAKNYEDPLVEVFFELGSIQMRRLTNSQDFIANAYLRFARNEFIVDFVTLNSRVQKPRQINKKWSDTIGALSDESILYLKDQSSIEFIPQDHKSFLLLSVFWQVFQDGLNGESRIFHNPIESGLGHRLREAANYIIENRRTIGPDAIFNLSDVPSRINEEEFFAHGSPRFPEVRDKIQRWRLLAPLGAGGFGQVFKAEHADTGEFGAIKLMSPTRADNKIIPTTSQEFRRYRERFLDEATLSMKVSSPFVVPAIDYGKDPWPWIRYPLIEGQSITQALQQSSDARSEWWNLAHDLLSGLSTIHLEGLIHKDVKPDNMLHASDQFVLLDLGIGEVLGYSELTGLGGIGGTYGFMAPELLLKNRTGTKPGFEIDIFSAGMTLLSIFDNEPLFALRNAQLSTREDADSDHLEIFLNEPISLEHAPDETWPLLSAMLNYDPLQRPPAKSLLKYVANFVDLEKKIQLIQADREARIPPAEDTNSRGTEDEKISSIKGPLKSWGSIEDSIYEIIDNVRPNYFIVNINPDDKDTMVYVQAMSGSGGWFFEAMSEAFSVNIQSEAVRKNFMRLNWTPPSASQPNYSMDLNDPPAPEIVRIFTDALEFGYGLTPSQVSAVKITAQGTDKY
jgi:serine/threonine protein kinase